MLKRRHNSLNGKVCSAARQTNSCLRLMVSFTFQGMDESGRSIARKCQPCPRTPVSDVSSLYTAAKKVSAAPHRGEANRPKAKQGKANAMGKQPEPNPTDRVENKENRTW